MFAYVSNRLPEIADHLYQIDDAMKAGFGWEHGPFEIWDAIGVEEGLKLIEAENLNAASWVKDLANNKGSFYSIDKGYRMFYAIKEQKPVQVPGQDQYIILDLIREDKTIWSNNDAAIQHIGNGVLNVEFRSKMNTIGGGVHSDKQRNRPCRIRIRSGNLREPSSQFFCWCQFGNGFLIGC